MELEKLLLRILIIFAIFAGFKLLVALNNKRFVNENRNPFGPKRTMHFAIFQSRAALDIFFLAVLFNFSELYEYLPEHIDTETQTTYVLIVFFLLFALNVLVRFLINEINVKRGKPDILENYWMPPEQ